MRQEWDLDSAALVPEPLRVLALALCEQFEQQYPGAYCSVLVADHEYDRLLHVAAPTLPPQLRSVLDGLPIAEGMGACGTAAARRAEVVVEDIATDPLTRAFTGLASTYALRSIWSRPCLRADGHLVGTFAVYRSVLHRPDATELAAMDQLVARLCGAIVELYHPAK